MTQKLVGKSSITDVENLNQKLFKNGKRPVIHELISW